MKKLRFRRSVRKQKEKWQIVWEACGQKPFHENSGKEEACAKSEIDAERKIDAIVEKKEKIWKILKIAVDKPDEQC